MEWNIEEKESYLQKMWGRSTLLNDRKRELLARRFPTLSITNLHLLEHRLVYQNPERLVGSHYEACFPRSFAVGDVELEYAPTFLLPATIVEIVELGSRTQED